MKNIDDILIEKLTISELSKLCEAYADGSLQSVFHEKLYPRDHQNNPEKYNIILKRIIKPRRPIINEDQD